MAGIAVVVGGVVATMVGGLMVRFGPRFGIIDLPDETGLKDHAGYPVPLGGTALMVGLHTGLVVAGEFDPAFFVASLIVWLVGLIDDLISLSPWVRIAGTVSAGIALVWIGREPDGALARIAVVALVVVVVNAINLLDGVDALAGVVSAVSALGLTALAATLMVNELWFGVLLAAVLIGFLIWNFPPARLFLGDNGAYVLGLALSWMVLRIGSDWASGLLAVAAIGVPVIELGATVVRRFRRGTPLFGGDRDHTYDRLLRSDRPILAVVLLFGVAQLLWSVSIVLLVETVGTTTTLVVAVCVGSLITLVLGLSDRRERTERN